MDKQIEDKLNAQITEFKSTAWREALEKLESYVNLTDMKLADDSASYRIGLELLKKDERLFRLSFLMRMCSPDDGHPYWRIVPTISLRKGDTELPGLEKRYLDLDKEISQIKGADIYDMVRSLINIYGLTR